MYDLNNPNTELVRVLVTGGRNFSDKRFVFSILDCIRQVYESQGSTISVVIHGDAAGADTLAGMWARASGIPDIACPADWNTHGKSAGPIRNRQP